MSKADGTDWTGPVGFITPDFIVKCAPDIAERRVHLCGPPAMMDAVKYALAQLKVPPDQIKTEDFCAAKGRSGSRGRTGRADAGKRSRCGTDRSWRRSG